MHRGAYIFVGLLALTAVLVLLLRVAAMNLDTYSDRVAAYLSEMLNADIQIDGLQLALSGVEPEVQLSGVRISRPDHPGEVSGIERLNIQFNLLGSLFGWKISVSDLYISGTDLLVVTHSDGESSVYGFPLAAPGEQVRFTLPAFHLERASVRWRNEQGGFEYRFPDVRIDFVLHQKRLEVSLHARLPDELGQDLHFSADLESSVLPQASGETGSGLSGKVHIDARGVDLARWSRLSAQTARASGVLTARLQGNFQSGVLQRLEGRVDCGSCSVAVTDAAPEVFSLKTDLSWSADDDGWLLELSGLGGEIPGLAAAVHHITATVDYGREGSRVALQAPIFDASVLPRIVAVDEWLRSYGMEIFSGQGPAGWSASIAYPEFSGETELPFLTWENWRRYPEAGVGFFVGYMKEHFRHLRTASRLEASEAKIGLRELSLRVPAWSQRVFDFDAVDMGARYIAGDPFMFSTEKLSLRFDDMNLSGRFMYRGGESPVIDADLFAENMQLTSVGGLLPEKGLKPGLKQWLSHAFTAGVMDTARIKMNGAVASFPFNDRNGRFHAQGEFSGVTLHYPADSKPLQDIEASVVFDNERMTATVSRLRYYDLYSRSATAVLKDITAPVIEFGATAEGPLSSVLAYLDDADLLDLDGVVMRGLEIDGNAHIELAVTVPLDKGISRRLLVEGNLGFTGNGLRIVPLDMRFEDIEGTLRVDRDGVHSRLLTANFNGVPVTGEAEAVNGGTRLTLTGELPAEQLTRRLPVALRDSVRGVSTWRGEFMIPGLRDDSRHKLQMKLNSTLEGTALDMPVPFGKTAAQQRALLVGLMVGSAGSEYDVAYGEEINARFVRNRKQPPKWSGYLHFGPDKPPEFDAGLFRITGEVRQPVDLGDWFGRSGGRAAVGHHLDHVRLSFAELRSGDSVLGEGEITVEPEGGGRVFGFDAPWLSGSGLLPDTAGKGMFIKLDRLFLPRGLSVSTATTLDPRTLWPIELEVASFSRGDMLLSNLRLLAEPSSEGMGIGRLDFEVGEVLMSSSGDWLFDGDRHDTRFDFSLRGENYGRSLRMLNVSEDFRGGNGVIKGQLGWGTWPGGFAAAVLEGDVSVELRDGTIKKADLGVGRLFGLLNAGHIVRRLSLDFSDVVDRGLAFDTMSGVFKFDEGVMRIEGLDISGPAAFMSIRGSNDLVQRKYDQHIEVVPNLRSNLPVASALLGGPIAGAVVFFLDRFTGVGSRVEDILTLRYHMHGDWEAPQIDFEGVAGVEAGQSKVKEVIRRLLP